MHFRSPAPRLKSTLSDGKNGEIQIIVRDDGPGFTEEELKNFGERRTTRAVSGGSKQRVSIGLGSVIMKAVAQAHRGSVVAANRVSASKEVVGAEVQVHLKTT